MVYALNPRWGIFGWYSNDGHTRQLEHLNQKNKLLIASDPRV
jgi:hypothetical protein